NSLALVFIGPSRILSCTFGFLQVVVWTEHFGTRSFWLWHEYSTGRSAQHAVGQVLDRSNHDFGRAGVRFVTSDVVARLPAPAVILRAAARVNAARRRAALALRPFLHLPGMLEGVPGDPAGRVASGPAVRNSAGDTAATTSKVAQVAVTSATRRRAAA